MNTLHAPPCAFSSTSATYSCPCFMHSISRWIIAEVIEPATRFPCRASTITELPLGRVASVRTSPFLRLETTELFGELSTVVSVRVSQEVCARSSPPPPPPPPEPDIWDLQPEELTRPLRGQAPTEA